MGLGAGSEAPLTKRCSPFAVSADARLLHMQPEIKVIVDAVQATLRRHGADDAEG